MNNEESAYIDNNEYIGGKSDIENNFTIEDVVKINWLELNVRANKLSRQVCIKNV